MWLEEGWKWRGQGTFVSCGVLSVCKAALKALSFTTCLHVHLPCESTLFTLPVSLHCTEVVFRSCFLQEAHEHSYDWDDQGSKCTKPHTGFVNMHEKAPGHARFQGARWQAHKKKIGVGRKYARRLSTTAGTGRGGHLSTETAKEKSSHTTRQVTWAPSHSRKSWKGLLLKKRPSHSWK